MRIYPIQKFFHSLVFTFYISVPILIAQETPPSYMQRGIGNLKYFQTAYPDIHFERTYDRQVDDWLITMTIPSVDKKTSKTVSLYWAGGSMLPQEELHNKDKYWPLLYAYPKVLADPADYTEEQKEAMKHFGSTENRQNGAGTPMFFFDAIYDSSSRRSLESHIIKFSFLGHNSNIHERIKTPLNHVAQRITSLAKTDKEVRDFVSEIKSNDAYFWRIIDGTNRKSFHSLGIAIDILPKSQHGKQIFWGWAKDKYPNTWMLIPLKDRWIPPQKIIDIFEEEGFIWGGKWGIWDNMHFEYHPELIAFNFHKYDN